MTIDLRELLPDEMRDIVLSAGEPSYRGVQLFTWLHRDNAVSIGQMTSLSKALRERLDRDYPLYRPSLVDIKQSDDGTKKYLFALRDGILIESVLMCQSMRTGHIRRTVCVSSQAGCAMGCAFCATATIGFKRNLTTGEIVSQVIEISAIEKIKIDNIVFMGMGEPLLNEEAVKKSALLFSCPAGIGISPRRITVSTCGLPDGIRSVALWGLDVVLAVSLSAPDTRTRDALMPVNKRYPLRELIRACEEYRDITGKRITFEYVMIKGVNIGKGAAVSLGKLLRGIPCNINLIPVNPGSHGFLKPDIREQLSFIRELRGQGLEAALRQEKGGDISGACGQLIASRSVN